MNVRLWGLAVLLLQPLSLVHADGGAVRLSERRGNYQITVFTSPTPLRAGPIDISVFIQDAASGEPVREARITLRLSPREHPGSVIEQLATSEAATNKLFQAAVFDLPGSGWWDVAISIEGLHQPLELDFAMEADERLPHVGEMTWWIAWPSAVVLLFLVHQGLVWRRSFGSKRIKKTGPHEGEPVLVTLSPNQRNNN